MLLEDRGFKDVFNVAGGIDVWALEIDPDMTRYD
jgi:rhodanese-related sulfurtransferase